MGLKENELIRIVGVENVIDAPETLDAYAKDYSFVPPSKPRFVVKPRNADQVQMIKGLIIEVT